MFYPIALKAAPIGLEYDRVALLNELFLDLVDPYFPSALKATDTEVFMESFFEFEGIGEVFIVYLLLFTLILITSSLV